MPAFARSITPFFQTARSALRQGNAVSPLQHALRRQNGAAVINAARSYATAFERSKPHVNIGMGFAFHGAEHMLIVNRYNWSRRSRKGT